MKMHGVRGKTIALLSAVILLASAGCIALLLRRQEADLRQHVQQAEKNARLVFQVIVDQMRNRYESRLQSMVRRNNDIVRAFARRDRSGLARSSLPLFNLLHRENPGIFRLCFVLPDDTAFLHLQYPHRDNDRLIGNHFLLVDVNRRQKRMSGFESGRSGFFFSIAQPVFQGEQYLGFLQLTIRINTVLEQVRNYLGAPCAIVLNREQAVRIRPDGHVRFALGNDVLFPCGDQFFLRQGNALRVVDGGWRVSVDSSRYSVFPALVLRDARGRNIGRLLVALNLDPFIIASRQALYEVIGLSVLLLLASGLILSFIFSRLLDQVTSETGRLEKKNREQAARQRQLAAELEEVRAELDRTRGRLSEEKQRHLAVKRALEQSSDEWMRAFDAIRDCVLILDTDLFILKANRAASLVLGRDRDQIKGIHCHQLFADRETPCPGCPTLDVRRDGRPHEVEIEQSFVGRTFLVSCAPISVEGELVGFVYTAKDISHQRNLERQLVQVQKMEAIATLAGGIAHDFNNILGAILGNADLLLYRLPRGEEDGARGGDPSLGFPEIAEHVQAIKRAGTRAKELVSQILAFSRQSTSRRRNVIITPVVKEAAKLLHSSLPAYIEVKTDIATDIGQIYADPTQVHQVLMNLCTNAAQAIGDRPGTILISLREVEAGPEERLRCPELKEGRYVVLTVKDTGRGMSAEVMERIFDPFFTTRQVGEGTGMGLAVLHGIVVAHDGAIDVQSEEGRGTVFSVYFPRVDDAEATETDTITAMPRGTETILFVDDEEDIVRMRTRMLEFLGYTVLAATSPEEALALLGNGDRRVDLVITDHSMPRMSGLQLAAEITKIQGDLPIILCSGYSEAVTTEDARKVGIRRFLTKPLDMRLLATAIRELLSTRE